MHPTANPAPAAVDAGPRRFHRIARVVLLAAAGLSLCACVQTGDFGRPQRGVWNDFVLPQAGAYAAAARGEPVSVFPYTDLEEELRDRAWRFLMPAQDRPSLDRTLADLARARVIPASEHPFDPTSYYRGLLSESFASPASRFRRIGEDAEADLRLVGPFAAVAARVIDADRARLRSLAYVGELSAADVAESAARVIENRCLIAWVRAETGERTQAYRYALEHAFIAMPQNEAAEAERAVKALALHRRTLDALPVPLWRDGTCVELSLTEKRTRRSPPLAVKG
jgi:hypothetical protein